jgi:hypothetical protein
MSERFPLIPDDAEAGCNQEVASFVKVGRGVQEVLQSVEDMLMDAGYDDFVVATKHGSFNWRTVRAEAAETEIEDDYGLP